QPSPPWSSCRSSPRRAPTREAAAPPAGRSPPGRPSRAASRATWCRRRAPTGATRRRRRAPRGSRRSAAAAGSYDGERTAARSLERGNRAGAPRSLTLWGDESAMAAFYGARASRLRDRTGSDKDDSYCGPHQNGARKKADMVKQENPAGRSDRFGALWGTTRRDGETRGSALWG